MALVTLKKILSESINGKYAVGAFDSMNHPMTEAILGAASNANLPVILMFPGDVVERPDADLFFRLTRMMVDETPVPVAIHLDHGGSYEVCMKALHYGFSGLMFDGSALPVEENIAITRNVVQAAHAAGVSVEAEVGHVGGLEGNTEAGVVDESMYTKTADAVRFVEETGIDALAVAIGTVHGLFKFTPKIDLNRLADIRKAVQIPLVLHGGTGLSDDDFRAVVAHGINKINFFTGISFAAVKKTDELLKDAKANQKNLHVFDVVDCCKAAIDEVVTHQMEVFGTKPLR